MCGLVVHQTDPCTSWGVGVLRYHRIPPLRPTSTDHSVLWVCRTAVRRMHGPSYYVRYTTIQWIMMSGWLWSLTPMYWVTVEPQDGQNWDPAGDDRGRFAHRTVIRGCVNRHNMSVTRRFDGLRWPSGLRTLAWTCTCLSQSIHPPVGPLGDRFLVKPAPFSGTAPRPEHVR